MEQTKTTTTTIVFAGVRKLPSFAPVKGSCEDVGDDDDDEERVVEPVVSENPVVTAPVVAAGPVVGPVVVTPVVVVGAMQEPFTMQLLRVGPK